MSSRRQKLLARVNWYLQSSLKHIAELNTGNKSYNRGGRYRQVSLYNKANVLADVHMDQDVMIGIFEVYLGNPFLWLQSYYYGREFQY